MKKVDLFVGSPSKICIAFWKKCSLNIDSTYCDVCTSKSVFLCKLLCKHHNKIYTAKGVQDDYTR